MCIPSHGALGIINITIELQSGLPVSAIHDLPGLLAYTREKLDSDHDETLWLPKLRKVQSLDLIFLGLGLYRKLLGRPGPLD